MLGTIVAAKELRAARSGHGSTEERLGHYLQAAAEAGPLIGQGAEALAVRDIYNAAVAEFTILLRSAEGGRLWNQPLTLTAGGASYRLRYAPASRQEGVWAPDYFTAFETPREVLLSLHDPTLREAVRIAGKTRPLAADYRAARFLPESALARAAGGDACGSLFFLRRSGAAPTL